MSFDVGHVGVLGNAGGGTVFTIAEGGDTDGAIDGDYKYHIFLSSGTFEITTLGDDAIVEYLVIAGGGGGYCGGGGAGGYRTAGSFVVTETSYSITIGAGGTAGNCNISGTQSNGGDSIFSTITSDGGGAGGSNASAGSDGGSGGGGSQTGAGGSATAGQGFDGGTGNNVADYPAGGGGGAKEVGYDYVSNTISGNGGDGLSSSITGSAVIRGDGGGGSMVLVDDTSLGGDAGLNGGDYDTAGTANTGTGGGAHKQGANAAIGGSGIVIVRYKYK